MLINIGIGNVIMVDKDGILCSKDKLLSDAHRDIAGITNKKHVCGSLADALKGADLFVGVSAPGIVSKQMICLLYTSYSCNCSCCGYRRLFLS